MDTQLVEYLLGSLEEPRRLQLEDRLRQDAALQGRLDLLRKALTPLEADRALAPPASLVPNTIALAAEHMCRPLPKAPAMAPSSLVPLSPWWRRADVLLAASLLIAATGIAAPVLFHSHRHRAQTAQCQENLRTYAVALDSFHKMKGRYPHIADERPNKAAGLVVPILCQYGAMPKGQAPVCPGIKHPKPSDLSLDTLQALKPEDFALQASGLLPGYAYDLGFADAAGYHPRPRAESGLRSIVPLMADAPPSCSGDSGESLNHAGRGQNVLYQDGHVKFVKNRFAGVGGDDIYLNKDNQVAAGLDRLDSVLGCALAKP